MATPLFSALTTTFMPPPECTSSYLIEACDPSFKSTCAGAAFKSSGGCNSKSIICYPSVKTIMAHDPDSWDSAHSSYSRSHLELLELHTYSPGLYCPSGMTTATTVDTFNGPGVVCCPSGMTINSDGLQITCIQTRTEGTFVRWPECTPTTIPPGSATTMFAITADPVILLGQKIPSGSAMSSGSSSSGSSLSGPSSSNPSTDGPRAGRRRGQSLGVKVGLGVGIPLVALVLLYLASILIRRHRRSRTSGIIPTEGAPAADYTGKPELEGMAAGVPIPKAELDGLSWRAAPQGTIAEDSAGIYVHRPELEGTDISAKHGASGVHVIGTWELDGFTSGR
ncbi:hypothetical protein HD806DRAFT_503182 [Xylariaceae sp. AK1471]|nr:hypothetical protein HD806DRAFT_503182 [Xylariaceae sp. AK1471]